MQPHSQVSLHPARLLGTLALISACLLPPAVRAQVKVGPTNYGPSLLLNNNTLNTGGYTSVGETSTGSLTLLNHAHFNTTNILVLGLQSSGTGIVSVSGGSTVSSGLDTQVGWQGTGALTVDGAGSSLQVLNGGLFSGWQGTGHINLTNGGNLTANGWATLADQTGSHGNMTIDGAGSLFNLTGGMTLGRVGVGIMNVQNGGALQETNGALSVGSVSGATGTLTVTGAGSTATIGGESYIGSAGQGSLLVQNGGVFHSVGYMGVGQDAGGLGSVSVQSGGALIANQELHVGEGHLGSSQGALTATGSGSHVQVDHGLIVGQWGNGTLSVQNDATVSAGDHFDLAAQTGSAGIAVVDGAGSALAVTGSAYLGGQGTAALTVQHGGSFDATGWSALGIDGSGTMTVRSGGGATFGDTLSIGHNATGLGNLSLEGSGSTVSAQDLLVGWQGTGSLAISAGAEAHAGNVLTVGWQGAGSVSVDGPGSKLSANGYTSLGDRGVASMTLTNGADFAAGDTMVLGLNSPGNASLAVQSGSSATVREMQVGWQGTGALTVDGAGSSLNVAGGGLITGWKGTGTVDIIHGGTLTSTGWGAQVGAEAGSAGAVTVDGAGSTWTNSGDLLVGWAGTGSLAVSHGGAVSTHVLTVGGDFSTGTGHGTLAISGGGTVTSFDGLIGNSSGSTGAVTVDGAGSAWHISSDLEVGLAGTGATGALAITNGGAVSAGWYMGIGDNGNAGAVTVDGPGSSLSVVGGLDLGDSGPGMGTLAITSGGSVSNEYSNIGGSVGSVGAVTVDGAGSTWTASGDLQVGFSGTGSLAITNGGAVSSASSSGFITSIGRTAGSAGAVSVDGSGSSWTIADQLIVGNAGTGSLAITNGGAVAATAVTIAANAGSSGTVTVDGGTLNTSAITIGTSGTLNFNSTSTGSGAINTSTITNAGQFTLNTRDPIAGSADTRTLGAAVTNQAGGRIDVNLANAASVTFTGPVTNDGVFQVTQLAGTSGGVTTFTDTFTNNGTFTQDPTTTHFAELFNAGYFSAGEGDQILVDAGFHNDGHLILTGSTLGAGAGLINHGLVDIFGGAEISGDYSGPGVLLFHIGSATDRLFFTSGFSGSLELVFDPGYLLSGTENFLHFNQGAYLSSLLIGGVDFGSRDFSGPGFLAGNGSFLAGSVPDSAGTLGLFGLALGLLLPLRRRLATS